MFTNLASKHSVAGTWKTSERGQMVSGFFRRTASVGFSVKSAFTSSAMEMLSSRRQDPAGSRSDSPRKTIGVSILPRCFAIIHTTGVSTSLISNALSLGLVQSLSHAPKSKCQPLAPTSSLTSALCASAQDCRRISNLVKRLPSLIAIYNTREMGCNGSHLHAVAGERRRIPFRRLDHALNPNDDSLHSAVFLLRFHNQYGILSLFSEPCVLQVSPGIFSPANIFVLMPQALPNVPK